MSTPQGRRDWKATIRPIAQVAIVALLAATYALYQDRVDTLLDEQRASRAATAEVATLLVGACKSADQEALQARNLDGPCTEAMAGDLVDPPAAQQQRRTPGETTLAGSATCIPVTIGGGAGARLAAARTCMPLATLAPPVPFAPALFQ